LRTRRPLRRARSLPGRWRRVGSGLGVSVGRAHDEALDLAATGLSSMNGPAPGLAKRRDTSDRSAALPTLGGGDQSASEGLAENLCHICGEVTHPRTHLMSRQRIERARDSAAERLVPAERALMQGTRRRDDGKDRDSRPSTMSSNLGSSSFWTKSDAKSPGPIGRIARVRVRTERGSDRCQLRGARGPCRVGAFTGQFAVRRLRTR
jgi:hypothetical protein